MLREVSPLWRKVCRWSKNWLIASTVMLCCGCESASTTADSFSDSVPKHTQEVLVEAAGELKMDNMPSASISDPSMPAPKATNLAPDGPLKRIAVLRGTHIRSPKSAIFSPDGATFYVNSLEGMETVAYDAQTLQCKAVIRHVFTGNDASLFLNNEETLFDYVYNSPVPEGKRNCFGGKPVEAAFSHGGRYLWVTYYRRDYDKNASSPSAVAVIDTQKNEIVRVIPTGPLAKMIVASPDGATMAIIHWGDNSIGLLDISSSDPKDFTYRRLLISGKRLVLKNISGNRDNMCGQCLRGAAFSRDSRYLFVGKMHGGGIAIFDLLEGKNLGTFLGIAPTPRHIVLSPDGSKLFVTSSKSGMVTELDVQKVLETVVSPDSQRTYRGRELTVGRDARTLAVSPDGKRLYVVCNLDSKLVRVDVASWKVTSSVAVMPYAVGVAVGPDERLIVTTSQGRQGQGGNVVNVYSADPALQAAQSAAAR